MSASIIAMHQAVDLLERLQDDREAALPSRNGRQHYWHVVRKARRGKRWIFHCRFFGSKSDVATFWRKNFMGKKEYRLVHMLEYGKNETN